MFIDVDEFVSASGLEKCVSAMDVNGCRQNESLIKTSQHSSPSVIIWRRENNYSLEIFSLVNAADFSSRTLYHWGVIMDYGLYGILVKYVLKLDLSQLSSSPDVNWWTVDYCDVFIRLSFWRHPFTFHCWDTFLQTWWRNTEISLKQ